MHRLMPSDPTSKPRVLIVDDEPLARLVTATRLKLLGATVVEAENGAIALDLLLAEPFNMAVIDLQMPTFDGFALINCIRGHSKLNHIPIVVLTGSEDPNSIHRALSAGATSYLLKPLNWSAFGEHIRSMLLFPARLFA